MVDVNETPDPPPPGGRRRPGRPRAIEDPAELARRQVAMILSGARHPGALRVLKRQDVAAALGISSRTLRRWTLELARA